MAKKRAVTSTARATSLTKESSAQSTPIQSVTTDTIVFDNPLDIACAGQLRQRLVAALQAKAPVFLDAANVDRVDTAALQVLTAFFKDADAAHVTVQWQQTSEALRKATRLLGLGPSLRLEQA